MYEKGYGYTIRSSGTFTRRMQASSQSEDRRIGKRSGILRSFLHFSVHWDERHKECTMGYSGTSFAMCLDERTYLSGLAARVAGGKAKRFQSHFDKKSRGGGKNGHCKPKR